MPFTRPTAPLGQEHPTWLAEGLASMYEAGTFDPRPGSRSTPPELDLNPHDNFRLTFIQNAARGHKVIPFDKLLVMTQKDFVDKAMIAYGESSSLMLYLYEQGQLKPFYEAYKTGFDKDPTGREALEKVSGQKLADLEKTWTAWMLRRPAPVLSTGPDGPFIGAKLAETTDGLRIDTMITMGPAARAGLKVGDVLVGIGDVEVRDLYSYGPVMSRHGVGEEIIVHIRRGLERLSVPVVLAKRSATLGPGQRSPTTRAGTKPG